MSAHSTNLDLLWMLPDTCPRCNQKHAPSVPNTLMTREGFTLLPLEIMRLLHEPPNSYNWRNGIGRIDNRFIVKHIDVRLAEAENSEYVRLHTAIPVPQVSLVFCYNWRVHLVYQFIEGRVLSEIWDQLDRLRKDEIATKVADYVRQLQALRPIHSSPGPVNPNATWRGRWFTEYDLGPMATHADLVSWFNHKRDVTLLHHPAEAQTDPTFTDNYPLVFTHGDLAARNFILGNDGTLWLIDWDRAGWCPAYIEYATVVEEANNEPIPGIEEWIRLVTSRMTDYTEELQSLKSIQWALHTAPFA